MSPLCAPGFTSWLTSGLPPPPCLALQLFYSLQELLKLYHAFEFPGDLIKLPILIQKVWVGTEILPFL